MKKSSKNLLKYIFVFFLLMLVVNGAEAEKITFGMSPPRIIAEHMLPGSHLEKIVTIIKDVENQEFQAQVEIEGQIQSWITTDRGIEFTISADHKTLPITIIINVPDDVSDGVYESKVNIKLSSATKPEDTASFLSVVLPISVKVIVTDKEVLDYKISSIKIPPLEEESPISILLKIENKGNIKAVPTKIQVDFLDKFKQGIIFSDNFFNITGIGPFTTGEVVLEIPNQLPSEQYWARISVYNEDVVLHKEEIIFDVLKNGKLEGISLAQLLGNSQEEKITKKPISRTGFLIIVFIIILVMIIFYLRKNGK